MKLKDLKNKKILILGFGREGKDTLQFFKKNLDYSEIAIADEREHLNKDEVGLVDGIKVYLGEEAVSSIYNYDVIIKAPGIPLDKLDSVQHKITSQTDLFLGEAKGRVIGITGSLGKSTTASLIYDVLKGSGHNVFLIGNIGEPCLSYLENDSQDTIYVQELSSYQLEFVDSSPYISVLLNIYREHLDHHRLMDNYIQAKANITKFQGSNDVLIYNLEDPIVSRIAGSSKATKVGVTSNVDEIGRDVESRFKADFYLLNINTAWEVAKLFDIDRETFVNTVRGFKPLSHRLEKVGTFKEIEFFNDSLSTIPESTIGALKSMGDSVQTIILGGYERDQKYDDLIEMINGLSIKTAVLFPVTGDRIGEGLGDDIKVFKTDSMEEAVKICYEHTESGKIALLSPAAPSFGTFKDYKDRGEQFKRYVKEYGQEEE